MAGQIEIQAKLAENRLVNLKTSLLLFKSQSRSFKNLTALSESLAEHFKIEFDDEIHPGTFRRNENFRKYLKSFLEKEKAQSMRVTDSIEQSIELRQAKKKIQSLEAELSVLNREVLIAREKDFALSHHNSSQIQSKIDFDKSQLSSELQLSHSLILRLMRDSSGYESDLRLGTVRSILDNEIIMEIKDFPFFFSLIKTDFTY